MKSRFPFHRSIIRATLAGAVLLFGWIGQACAGYLVEEGTITRMAPVESNSTAFSVLTTGGTGPCSAVWISFPVSAAPDLDTHKRLYATLLVAFAQGMRVSIYNYSSNSCMGAAFVDMHPWDSFNTLDPETRMVARINRIGKSLKAFAILSPLVLGAANAGTPTGPHTAYKLRITALVSVSNLAWVYFDGNHQCGGNRAHVDVSRSDFKTLYSTLLTAQTTGALVSVDLRDTSTNGSCNGDLSSIANMCVGDESGPCFSGW
jgi:hypothetical protein